MIAVFTNLWSQSDTNKMVGGLFPNDADGNASGDPNVGVGPGFAAAGYTRNDPGRYQNLTDKFTAQINAFKTANADSVTGVVIPPDFTTFRNQAIQRGYAPRSSLSPRRSSSRNRSRLWARPGTTCPARSGGRRRTRSNRR